MLTTLVLLAVIAGFLLTTFVAWGLLLGVGLRLVGQSFTWRRAAVTGLLIGVIEIAGAVVLQGVGASGADASLPLLVLGMVVGVGGNVVPIHLMHRVSFVKAFLVWLVTLPSVVVPLAFSFGVVRPFILTPYKVSGNSMVPTLLTWHHTDTCPQCGGDCYYAHREEITQPYRDIPEIALCEQFHSTDVTYRQEQPAVPDRIVSAKFLTPRRWDVVTFAVPASDERTWVKRVVGLPGETVYIENGKLIVDNKPIELPPGLAGVYYEDPDFRVAGTSWVTKEKPAVLGEGEYLVLGDNSSRSLDARYWQQGVPGHPPYAVPKERISGVVTHIVWPPSRWRVFR